MHDFCPSVSDFLPLSFAFSSGMKNHAIRHGQAYFPDFSPYFEREKEKKTRHEQYRQATKKEKDMEFGKEKKSWQNIWIFRDKKILTVRFLCHDSYASHSKS